MAAQLGYTKYGFGVTYSDQNGDSIARTYNGVNFPSDAAATKAQYLRAFVEGQFDQQEGGDLIPTVLGLKGIAQQLGMTGVNGYELIQRNSVTNG